MRINKREKRCRVENFVVVFSDHGVLVLSNPKNLDDYWMSPNALINPDLSCVAGFPTSRWKKYGEKVILGNAVARPTDFDIDKAKRPADLNVNEVNKMDGGDFNVHILVACIIILCIEVFEWLILKK